MNYQWYPGHMTKAKRMMQENIKLIDLIIELVDARIPVSSRNPDIDELGKNKSRIVLLNKSDLADPVMNKQWMAYFESQGAHVLEINSKTGAGVKSIQGMVQEACREKIERDRKRGIVNRPVRAMVVGIPNSGKSSFINRMANNKRLKTEDRPGVTVHKQWVKVSNEIELMDTPGILWPKLGDETVSLHLAFTGAIKSQILDVEELGVYLIDYLLQNHSLALSQRYKITLDESDDKLTVYDKIALKRGYIFSKNDPDYERCANAVLDDFKNGRFGKLSLETPEDL